MYVCLPFSNVCCAACVCSIVTAACRIAKIIFAQQLEIKLVCTRYLHGMCIILNFICLVARHVVSNKRQTTKEDPFSVEKVSLLNPW